MKTVKKTINIQREGKQENNQIIDTKNEVNKIKSDNLTGSNREKSIITFTMILESNVLWSTITIFVDCIYPGIRYNSS